MQKEMDLYVEGMRHKIQPESAQMCHIFATYLAKRRALKQLQNECWFSLLMALIKGQRLSYLPDLAESIPFDQWWDYTTSLVNLIELTRPSFDFVGSDLTMEQLLWWKAMVENGDAVHFLIKR